MTIDIQEKILHFKKPARTSRGAYNVHRMLILTARDDDGNLLGVGECAPLPDLSCDRHSYDSIIETEKLVEEALKSGNPDEYLKEYPALNFALYTAFHSYKESTPFSRGEEGIPINGLVWMSDFDDMLRQIERKLSDGFRCIKIKIGSIEWKDEVRLLSIIRLEFPEKDLELRVDANGAFSISDAPEKLKELSLYGIHSIEQPIRQGQWNEMAKLCSLSPVPIALDEELIGINDLKYKKMLLDTIKPSYIIIKPTLLGYNGAVEWIEEADKRNIPSWVTSALESNIGLRHVALFADHMYGTINMPQGLGTGLLFEDNVESDIEIRGSKLWIKSE